MDNSNDDFNLRLNYLNTLFDLIKSRKEKEFIDTLHKIDSADLDVNIRDSSGNYLIFFAVIMNSIILVEELVKYGARLDIINSDGFTILYSPIKFGYNEMLETLLKLDKTIIGISIVNLPDSKNQLPLYYTIKYRNTFAAKQLLDYGANVNYQNNDNMNALHLSVIRGSLEITEMIIDQINNIDAITLKGSTALNYACNFGYYEIAKILLEKGADQNIPEYEYDFYPIIYSVVQNNYELTKLLIKHRANPNVQDYRGNTIIYYSILNKNLSILDLIFESYSVQQKSDVYTENINDPEKCPDIPKIVCRVDPSLSNIEGQTILHLLLYNYQPELLKYIEKVIPFSDLNYQDNLGNSALHLIVSHGIWERFVDILALKKLNIYISNMDNQTVMDLIPLNSREKFISLVSKSFLIYLRKHPDSWILDWHNECSKESDNEKCIEKIKDEIIHQKSSVPIKKNKTNIVILEGEKVQFSTFTGSLLDTIVGFKFLIKIHPYAATVFHRNNYIPPDIEKYYHSLGIQEDFGKFLIQFEIRWIYQKIFFPPDFEKILANILSNKKYRYIVFSIGIILSNGNHSNGLFYDIEKMILERFEPHGSNYPSHFNYNPDLLDEILNYRFSNILSNIYHKKINLQYIPPKKYMPKIGFQTFENTEISVNKNVGDPNGFCTLWTIWYLNYRIKYADVRPEILVRNMIEQIRINKFSFRTIIRNFSKKITNLRDRYLNQIHKNINDYMNNRLTQNNLQQLLNTILED